MRILTRIALALALGGCEPSPLIRGSIADGSDFDSVWNFSTDVRAAVGEGRFEIEGGGAFIDLRFRHDADWSARMEIRGAPAGIVELIDIHEHDGLATPIAIRTDGAAVLSINGIRMMDADALPREVRAEGEVIGLSPIRDAILLRPTDEGLPDLRVVITPGTVVSDAEGGPSETDRLVVGDSAAVVGAVADGYVVAREVVVRER